MAFGIGNTQLLNNLTADPHQSRLQRTAASPQSGNGVAIWNPTSRQIMGREEIDKQNDDNMVFLFEFRALLNSRMQTLITSLSNALASDLDVAMSASNLAWTNDRAAMNGNSTPTRQDAGASRTAYNFMLGFTQTTGNIDAAGDFTGTGGFVDPALNSGGGAAPMTFAGPTTSTLGVGGTNTLCQSTTGLADSFRVDLKNNFFVFANTKHVNAVTDASFTGPLGQAAIAANAKSLTEKVIFDSLSNIEFKSVLRSGLFKNIIVSSSSSLATGSQAQASLSLSYDGTGDGGSVSINMDKFTAFYHS